MYVPSYQMHNVLDVYSKQLRLNVVSNKKDKMPNKPQTDRVNIMPDGKRKATIEKVSKDIIDKISSYRNLNETRRQFNDHLKVASEDEALGDRLDNKSFVYNMIDSINIKTTNTLSVDDSNFLIQRLEQLAKKASNKEQES